MTVTSIKITGGVLPLYRIGLSDGSLFSLNPRYLPPEYQDEGFFYPEKEIDSNEEGALRFASACYRTERVALQLTARAEQTGVGIARKLEKRGHESRCIKTVISRLIDLEILLDSRFAALWVQSRLSRSACSPNRLLHGLLQRGVDRDTAREACKTILNFERETALLSRYLEKKGLAPGEDPYLKQRLKQEGFSSAVLQAYWESYL
jgi:SOS response regulatory protein OraA/RecX